MKSNDSKCHLIIHDADKRLYTSKSFIYLGNKLLENEESVKLLGVWIDNKVTFEQHIKNLLKKGNQKLHALMRIKKYLVLIS